MKNHKTFAGEQQEMPQPEKRPEVSKPADPKVPDTPIENPESVPEEIPPGTRPDEEPPKDPSNH
jgi:hypothetical protein